MFLDQFLMKVVKIACFHQKLTKLILVEFHFILQKNMTWKILTWKTQRILGEKHQG